MTTLMGRHGKRKDEKNRRCRDAIAALRLRATRQLKRRDARRAPAPLAGLELSANFSRARCTGLERAFRARRLFSDDFDKQLRRRRCSSFLSFDEIRHHDKVSARMGSSRIPRELALHCSFQFVRDFDVRPRWRGQLLSTQFQQDIGKI